MCKIFLKCKTKIFLKGLKSEHSSIPSCWVSPLQNCNIHSHQFVSMRTFVFIIIEASSDFAWTFPWVSLLQNRRMFHPWALNIASPIWLKRIEDRLEMEINYTKSISNICAHESEQKVNDMSRRGKIKIHNIMPRAVFFPSLSLLRPIPSSIRTDITGKVCNRR